MTRTIKQFVEEMTDQRVKEDYHPTLIDKRFGKWMLQWMLYIKVLTSPTETKPSVVIITNTPY